MTASEIYLEYQDVFEYHGNTSVERVRKQGPSVLRRDWILFDSVEEAQEFFLERC